MNPMAPAVVPVTCTLYCPSKPSGARRTTERALYTPPQPVRLFSTLRLAMYCVGSGGGVGLGVGVGLGGGVGLGVGVGVGAPAALKLKWLTRLAVCASA